MESSPTAGREREVGVRFGALLLLLATLAHLMSAAPASAQTPTSIERLAGTDRIGTAVAISRQVFPDGAPAVVLARADEYSDALAGAPLAALLGAPILLTAGDGLAPEVADELRRLNADRAVLLGGTGALSPTVEREATAAGAGQVQRFAGTDRFDTARLVAEAVLAETGGTEAYLTLGSHPETSRGWPDAVALSGLAAAERRPVLLTAGDRLAPAVPDLLRSHPLTRITVVGGPAALGDDLLAELRGVVTLDRVAGTDRFATSVAVAELALRGGADGRDIWLATGASYADALTGGAAVAASGGVLLLVDGRGTALQPALAFVTRRAAGVRRAFLLGGEAALPDAVRALLLAILSRIPDAVPPVSAPAPPPVPQGVRVEVGGDLQAAVDTNPPGTTFVLASGVHRMQRVRPSDGDRFVGEPGAVLSGARVLRDLAPADGVWAARGQTQEGYAHGEVLPGRERDRHPEDLFLDGVRLRHVADRTEVGPGTWHFDYADDTIYLGDDPGGRLVETSVTDWAFHGEGVRDVVIENLTIRHYANFAQHGAVQGRETIDWTVRRVEASANHGVGIGIGPGMHILDCRVVGNGQLGLGGYVSQESSRPVLVAGNEIAGNGELGFDWRWEAGALKLVGTTGAVLEQNWVHHNHGPGPWFDIDNVGATIRSNLVEHNEQAGIVYEISYGATIADNVVRDNGTASEGDDGAGVHVSNSRDVEIHGNALYGNRHEVMATHVDRGVGPHGRYQTTGLYAHGNDVRVDEGEPGLRVGTGETELYRAGGNRFARNTWRVRDGEAFFWGRHLDAAGWRAQGHDLDGTFLPLGGTPRLPTGAQPFAHRPVGPEG